MRSPCCTCIVPSKFKFLKFNITHFLYWKVEAVLHLTPDIAKFLRVETAVVYAACSKDELPFLKIGKLYKFKKTDVLKWLENEKQNKVVDIDGYVNKYLQNNILKG